MNDDATAECGEASGGEGAPNEGEAECPEGTSWTDGECRANPGEGEGEPPPQHAVCEGPGSPPEAGWLLDDGEECDVAAPPNIDGPAPPDPGDIDIADPLGRQELIDGDTLCRLLAGAPRDTTQAPAPPQVTIYPRGESYVRRLAVRACIHDPNGLGDIDCRSLDVTLDGLSIADEMIWFQHRPSTLCGQVQSQDFVRGWREPEGAEAIVEVSIEDLSGQEGRESMTYRRASAPSVRFTDVAREASVAHVFFKGNTHNGGVAWIDVNDDDLPDLYITNGTGRTNHLLRNDGDGGFTDITDGTPLAMEEYESSAAIFADVDNDGDDDLYVMGSHPLLTLAFDGGTFENNPVPGHRSGLFINRGRGRCWEDATVSSGLADLNDSGHKFRTETGAFADYDRDGCVDLFLVHRRLGGLDEDFDGDRLYRNNCDGTFSDATDLAGIDDGYRDGLGVLFEDLDGDLWPDLYIVHTSGGGRNMEPDELGRMSGTLGDDMLWRNRGDGTFEEITLEAQVGTHSFAGMGIVAGDIDRDGDLDLHITDITESLSLGNPMYRSLLADTGTLRFEEVSFELGDVPLSGDYGWGNILADFDNDGWTDLFYAGPTTRWLYMNDGAGGFHSVSGPQGGPNSPGEEHGLPDVNEARGVAAADYDRDGDVDLVVLQENPRGQFVTPQLLRNDTPPSDARHWLEIRLRPHLTPSAGGATNPTAIGARVEARPQATPDDPTAGPIIVRQITGGHSAFSQSEKVLHFGLGEHERIGLLRVFWPSGRVQTLCEVQADRLLTIYEPAPPG